MRTSTALRQPYIPPPAPLVSIHRLKIKCPVCDHRDNCAVSADGRVAYCRRVRGDHQGRDGGWLHVLHGDAPTPAKVARRAPPVIQTFPLADADHLHDVFVTLLREDLVLSREHRDKALDRGLSEFEIERCALRSAPTRIYGERVAQALSRRFDLEGVPGFWRDAGRWQMVDYGAGMYVPVRDECERIVGLQLRRDEGEPRYIWFSSNRYPGGTSSGAPVHFARVDRIRATGEATLTEGSLKGSVASHLLDMGVIALPGVNFAPVFAPSLRRALPELHTIFVAFDMDFQEKEQVAAPLFRLLDELQKERFTVRLRTWPRHQGKGIDDYLLNTSKSEGRVAA